MWYHKPDTIPPDRPPRSAPQQREESVSSMDEQAPKRMKLIRRTAEQRQAAEAQRLAPMMRALKAIHSSASPYTMSPEDLDRQRRGQELLGRLAAPTAGMSWEPFSIGSLPAAWARPLQGYNHHRAILY